MHFAFGRVRRKIASLPTDGPHKNSFVTRGRVRRNSRALRKS